MERVGDMTRFLAGIAVGAILGTAGLALSAEIVGRQGYLTGGWTVTKGGAEICDTPFIWPSTKEIECD
jgi:hypothetical protein